MNRQHFINNLWRWKCGLPEIEPARDKQSAQVDIEELKRTQWSEEFEGLMRNRLVLGAIRYGKLHAPNKPKYDRIGSAVKRLHKFNKTGNKEYLVDAANLCLLEFEECNHPNQHFSAIDDGEHVSVIKQTTI